MSSFIAVHWNLKHASDGFCTPIIRINRTLFSSGYTCPKHWCIGQRHGQQRKANKNTGCECDGGAAMDVLSHEETDNQKRTCERIIKVAPVTMKLIGKRLKCHGHVNRRDEGPC